MTGSTFLAGTASSPRLAISGLDYVGLPLAVEFGKHYPVVGFDINVERINDLEAGSDTTREVEAEELAEAKQQSYSCDAVDLVDCNIYSVTVPTSNGKHKQPDGVSPGAGGQRDPHTVDFNIVVHLSGAELFVSKAA